VGIAISGISAGIPVGLLGVGAARQPATVSAVPAVTRALGDSVSVSAPAAPAAAGLAQVGATLDAPARVSNALAVADAALERVGAVLGRDRSENDDVEIRQIASAAKFAGKPLLDGGYSASLNGSSITLPRVAGLDGAADAVTTGRADVARFRKDVIAPTLRAGQRAMEALAPGTSAENAGASLALLVRAKMLVNPQDAANTTLASGARTLPLIA
jgi:hypothetical protein